MISFSFLSYNFFPIHPNDIDKQIFKIRTISMYSQFIMPLQNNLTNKTGEFSSIVANSIWSKTPQQKIKQILNDSKNRKRRSYSDQYTSFTTINSSYSSDRSQSKPNSPTASPSFIKSKPLKQNQFKCPFYAGAKFSDAPKPSILPQPPTHWINSTSSINSTEHCSSLNGNALNRNSLNNNGLFFQTILAA